jgi:hypothetical protein
MSEPQVLTDFGADPVRHYVFRDGRLSADTPMLHEFASFTATKVVLQDKSIELDGIRSFVVENSETHALVATGIHSPMTIRLTMEDPDFDVALPLAAKQLFFSSVEEAAASVPDFMAKSAPALYNLATTHYESCKPCRHGKPSGEGVFYAIGEKYGVVAPKLIHQVDPEFRASHFNGVPAPVEILYGMIVGTDGIPKEIWLLQPAGTELDWDGFKAISQYRFAPATKDGVPVPVHLNVAVNFQIHSRS